MKKFRFVFLPLAALAVISLATATPVRLVQAQRNGEGGGNTPLSYPESKRVDVVDDQQKTAPNHSANLPDHLDKHFFYFERVLR